MGQFAKRLLRSCTRPLLVLCRPFLRRVDSYLNCHIAQLSGQLSIWHAQQMQSLRDFDILGDSLVRPAGSAQGRREIAGETGIVGPALSGLLKDCYRLRRVSFSHQSNSEVGEAVDILWIVLERLPETFDGFFHATSIQEFHPRGIQARDSRGIVLGGSSDSRQEPEQHQDKHNSFAGRPHGLQNARPLGKKGTALVTRDQS